MQMFEPLDEVTVTGEGIEVAISNFNNQGYCSTLNALVVLCKHTSKNSCVTFIISITSTICVFITSFSATWLSIPVGGNKYKQRKLRAHILISFRLKVAVLNLFIQGGLDLGCALVLEKKTSPTVTVEHPK